MACFKSCDTFVALPPSTAGNYVIFGKNADRPDDEVQEVVYFPSENYKPGSSLQCTYIEIEQVTKTYGIVLSKPSWMWGAEMGANEKGVAIGNEAVWTHLGGKDDLQERLLGMDLLRLALERSATAKEGLDTICTLLERYGQGGPCSEQLGGSSFAYHNSFLIADPKEAWVLETAGNVWAAELISSGCRNISNQLTIRKNITLHSANMKTVAKNKNLWNGTEEFDFAQVYSFSFEETNLVKGHVPTSRQLWGTKLLNDFDGSLDVYKFMNILRHKESGICMEGSFQSAGSQVSLLSEKSIHFFTGTPIPIYSIYKPFIFHDKINFSDLTKSPKFDNDPARNKPRFLMKVDRRHKLWLSHENMLNQLNSSEADEVEKARSCLKKLKEFEINYISDVLEIKENVKGISSKNNDIFNHMVILEMNFYKEFDISDD